MSDVNDRWEFYQCNEGKWFWRCWRRNKKIRNPFDFGYEKIINQTGHGFNTKEECKDHATRFGFRQ